jgi:hypothetical protein
MQIQRGEDLSLHYHLGIILFTALETYPQLHAIVVPAQLHFCSHYIPTNTTKLVAVIERRYISSFDVGWRIYGEGRTAQECG